MAEPKPDKPDKTWSHNKLIAFIEENWNMGVTRALRAVGVEYEFYVPKYVLLPLAQLSQATSHDFERAKKKLLLAKPFNVQPSGRHPPGAPDSDKLPDIILGIVESINSERAQQEESASAVHQSVTSTSYKANSATPGDALHQGAREQTPVTLPVEPHDKIPVAIRLITDRITELEGANTQLERANIELQIDKASLEQQKRDLQREKEELNGQRETEVHNLQRENEELQCQRETEALDYRKATLKLSTQMFAAAIEFPDTLEKYISEYLPADLRDQFYKSRDLMAKADSKKRKSPGSDVGPACKRIKPDPESVENAVMEDIEPAVAHAVNGEPSHAVTGNMFSFGSLPQKPTVKLPPVPPPTQRNPHPVTMPAIPPFRRADPSKPGGGLFGPL